MNSGNLMTLTLTHESEHAANEDDFWPPVYVSPRKSARLERGAR